VAARGTPRLPTCADTCLPKHQRTVTTVSTASCSQEKRYTLVHVSRKRLTMQPCTCPGCAVIWISMKVLLPQGLPDPPNNAKVPCTTIYSLFYIKNIYYMVSLYKAECSTICYHISAIVCAADTSEAGLLQSLVEICYSSDMSLSIATNMLALSLRLPDATYLCRLPTTIPSNQSSTSLPVPQPLQCQTSAPQT
jgi:hypothetical protein